MLNPTHWDTRLDVAGRWLLTALDYREWGFFILAVIIVFAFWRNKRYGAWPPRDDYFRLLFALLTAVGGLTAMVVFLLTKPPAVDMLSGPMLVLLGLGVPILMFGESLPRVKALFFPSQAPPPAKHNQPEVSKTVTSGAPAAIKKSRR